MSGESLQLTPHESIVIRSVSAEAIEVEATYSPGKRPPKHYHPSQDEHFEVLEGTIGISVDGVERTLAAGGEIDVPRGTVHQLWNPDPEPARVLWRTSPAGRTEQWFRKLDGVRREGKIGRNGMPSPLAFGVYLTAYRDTFRLAGPDWLLRPAFAVLGVAGRLRGYRA